MSTGPHIWRLVRAIFSPLLCFWLPLLLRCPNNNGPLTAAWVWIISTRTFPFAGGTVAYPMWTHSTTTPCRISDTEQSLLIVWSVNHAPFPTTQTKKSVKNVGWSLAGRPGHGRGRVLAMPDMDFYHSPVLCSRRDPQVCRQGGLVNDRCNGA